MIDGEATAMTGGPATNPSLARNPVTGTTHIRQRYDRASATPDQAPVARHTPPRPHDPSRADVLPSGGAADALMPSDLADLERAAWQGAAKSSTSRAHHERPQRTLPAAVSEAATDITALILTAYHDRDVDTLAAAAHHHPDHAGAAHLLAATAAGINGDPRALAHLNLAWHTGQDPAALTDLADLLHQIRFTIDIPAAFIRTTLPCTRDHLTFAVAAADLAVGDPESAYTAISEAPTSHPLTAILTILAADALSWPRKADAAIRAHHDTLTGDESPGRFTAALALTAARHVLATPAGHGTISHDTAHGTAHDGVSIAGTGAPHEAANEPALTAMAYCQTGLVAAALADTTEPSHASEPSKSGLVSELRYTCARAALAAGREDDAWDSLTTLLREHPDHQDARALLKSL